MQVRFWGTRGSLAKPGPTTLRYGGNTSCVEVRAADQTLIVLDCGTGAHGLGLTLARDGPVRGHLLITHTHWDHIQGFPFFAPLFASGNDWDIYAPGGLGLDLEKTLAGQMEYAYFPVTLGQLSATIRYHDLVESTFAVGGVRIVSRYLNHPALALGYRLEAGGVAVVYAVDHEPHATRGESREPSAPLVHAEDIRHAEFLAGADLVIHDAQYVLAEYPPKVGWGHTPAEWAVDYALAARAKRLALFHHDPMRSDLALDEVVETCRARVATARGSLDVFAAAEGQVVDLGEGTSPQERAAELATAVSPTDAPLILVADDDPTIVKLLTLTLSGDGYRVLVAGDGETAWRLTCTEHPALVLLDWQMPAASGIDVTRRLREHSDASIRDVPVVLITAQTGSDNTATGFEAGVTDYLTKPFRPAHVRARVRAWLLRRAPGTPAP